MVFGNIGQAEDINDEIKYFCCRILEILIKKKWPNARRARW